MSNTLLERTRQLHEDIERSERLAAQDLKRTMTRYKDRLQQDHRTKRFIDEIQECSRKLIKIYDDEEGVRKAEIDKLGGTTQFSAFYERLKEIKDHHRLHPSYDVTQPPDDDVVIDAQMPLEFTGEEMYGRYLDLHEFYQKFINLLRSASGRAATPAPARAAAATDANGAQAGADDAAATAEADPAASSSDRAMEYITYVQQFTHFHRTPRTLKFTKAYLDYVQSLLRYLISFHERTQPLKPVMKLLGSVEDRFEERWSGGEILGWEDKGEGTLPADADLVIDPEAFDSPEELLALGADKVKAALQARNLKVGGTPLQRAQRLILCATKPLRELPASAFVAGAAPAATLGEGARTKRLAAAQQVANVECKVLAVVESLGAVVDDTHGWVEKKLAQNYEELKQDIGREDFDIGGDDSDEEDEYVYNPLKLPTGVDGKPIPYWLYKLHGLNQEYSCDICGGDLFKGRREYERHFRDSKHVTAMHALGIPSSKAFFEVTKVDEALALWENLKKRGSGNWHADTQEEFEDDEGNVYNKKTYEDLQRQGLV